tara:strand:- start:426 stop:749 length:324 start_codon:yes stop_codon:yes gene_type:complete
MNPADREFYHHPPPIYEHMNEQTFDQFFILVERLGVSFAVVLLAFAYIYFITKQSAKERAEYMKKDSENDDRLMKIVESTSDALLHVKIALEQNTQAMREFIRYRRE